MRVPARSPKPALAYTHLHPITNRTILDSLLLMNSSPQPNPGKNMNCTQKQVQRSVLPEVIQNAKKQVAEKKYRPMHRTLRLDITKPDRAVHIAGTTLKINLYR